MDRNGNEIRSLVESGIAQDDEHASRILQETAQRRKRADLYIFYTDHLAVKACLGKQLVVNAKPYDDSNIRMASVPCGALGQIEKRPGTPRPFAIGALKELVPRRERRKEVADQEAMLVAFVRNFPVQDKSGVFLSPFSAEAVHARGKRTIDERENLLRVEFTPFSGDFILGMFSAWNLQTFGDSASLILWMPKSQTILLS